jgi:hypothetical protein
MSGYNPAGTTAHLNGPNGLLFAGPTEAGIVSFTRALVGSLTISTSAGTVTTFAAGTTGVQPLPTSGGANNTFWAYSNAGADGGAAWASAPTPNTTI